MRDFPSTVSNVTWALVWMCSGVKPALPRFELSAIEEGRGVRLLLDALTRDQMVLDLLRIWSEDRRTAVFITHDIEESIFLSDRIYVMTARPGRIKAEIEIPLERPRSYEIKATDTFLALKKRALTLIREEALKATQAGA